MKKYFSDRFQSGYMEPFLTKIDPKWGEFWSKLYTTKRYELILKTVVVCNECRIFFSFGKSDTEFSQIYEFSDYGGEKILFYEYLYRDSEGTFNDLKFWIVEICCLQSFKDI